MNRAFFKVGAAVGAMAVAALSAGPALADTPVSQATAQSVVLNIAGTSVVAQKVSAVNDGSQDKVSNSDTIPDLANVAGQNNSLFVGAAPEEATATVDKSGNGNSYACAGVAGTGGGIVSVGTSHCKIGEGNNAATLDLANVSLGNKLLGPGAITDALNSIDQTALNGILGTLSTTLNGLTTKLTNALDLPVALQASLSTVEGVCSATPTAATGDATLADAKIGITVDGTSTNLVTLPVNPAPNTSLTDLSTVTSLITGALNTQLSTALNGALTGFTALPTSLQNDLLTPLSAALVPLTDAIKTYLANVTLNEQTSSDGGKKIDVAAIDAKVVPSDAIPGGNLLQAVIGHVTCGPNGKVTKATPTPTPTPTPTKSPGVPKHVDSGLAGDSGNSENHNALIAGGAALLAVAGSAGVLAYRRYGMPRG